MADKNQYFNEVYSGMNQKGDHNYFSTTSPKTQMQLTFQNHFKSILSYCRSNDKKIINVLEQGCGAGNLSLYFANAGCNVTCMDIEEGALSNAKENFNRCNLSATFIQHDASEQSDESFDNKYDLIYSVGLLEHLKLADTHNLLLNNLDMLNDGGMIVHYVIPKKESIQQKFNNINDLMTKHIAAPTKPQTIVPRYEYSSQCYTYLTFINKFKEVRADWCMPIPLISPSPKFPFTRCPNIMERSIVALQKLWIMYKGWLCDEKTAQGFYLVAVKR